MGAKLTDFELGLTRKVMALQARCDALDAVVEVMALKLGSTRQKFLEGRKRVCAAALQKRLETVEAVDPSAACSIDDRTDSVPLDMNILRGLVFDDEGDSGDPGGGGSAPPSA